MNRRHALFALFLLGPLAACEKKDESLPESVDNLPQEDPAAEAKRLRRPPPATSGIGSDPRNPNGAPGSGPIGTSATRY